MLPAAERVILCRLSVFVGSFTLQSAGAVVSDGDIAAADVVDCLANLVAKSLVTAEVNEPSHFTACSKRRAPTRWKSCAKWRVRRVRPSPRGTLPGFVRKARAEWDQQSTAESLDAYSATTSTTCGSRWTGPSRRLATRRSARRCPLQPYRCRSSFR